MVKKNIIILVIVLISLFAIFVSVGSRSNPSSAPAKKQTETVNKSNAHPPCQFMQSIGDLNNDGIIDYILFCGETIYAHYANPESLYDQKIEDISSFPDLFYYTPDNGKTKLEIIKQVFLFPKNNPQFFVISSMMNGGPWQRYADGVYKFQGGIIRRVFKRGFREITGRWPFINFDNTRSAFSLNGDHGYIGCLGCRLDWIDFYTWSELNQEFVLDNVNHKEEFQKLLVEYQRKDNSGCKEGLAGTIIKEHVNLTFSELYKKYPDEKIYCNKKLGIYKEDVLALIKSIKIIKEIIIGNNVTYEESNL